MFKRVHTVPYYGQQFPSSWSPCLRCGVGGGGHIGLTCIIFNYFESQCLKKELRLSHFLAMHLALVLFCLVWRRSCPMTSVDPVPLVFFSGSLLSFCVEYIYIFWFKNKCFGIFFKKKKFLENYLV